MYKKLSRLHPEFVYERYWTKKSRDSITFNYKFSVGPDIVFEPRVVIPIEKRVNIDKKTLSNLAFNVGLVEIPNYWKATCSPRITIRAGSLKKGQISFLKKLITNGLGEFFYSNGIDPTRRDLVTIESAQDAPALSSNRKINIDKQKVLVPMGGGKDSIVTLEILRQSNFKVGMFQIRTKTNFKTPPLRIKTRGLEEKLVAEKTIDKRLLELNRRGYLNGHTPFSAYIAFLSTATAILNGYKYIAVSNEKSANEGNLEYKGMTINHQWSKSYEFEKLFREYSAKFISKDLDYFSFLRPLNEMQIAELFTRYPKYFRSFNSCNIGSKHGKPKWCNKCPKCLFTYIMLYPFLGRQTLKRIFGQDLLDKKSLLPQARALLGLADHKPLECVGTEDEVAMAMKKGLERDANPPFIVRQVKSLLGKSTARNFRMSEQHFLPKSFETLLRRAVQQSAR